MNDDQNKARKAARIQDVALAAGVSTATVSRALSNPKLLSEASREAVFNAVRATGYRTNQAARNLRKQRAGAVLVLVPNLGNPFFSQILSGIKEGFEATDYAVLIADTARLRPDQKGMAGYFQDSRIDGMIALDGGLSTERLDDVANGDIVDKIVFACEWVDGGVFPSVRSDNVKGAQLAMRHLYDLGHRRIAHITGPEGNVLTNARRDSIIPERQRLGLPVRDGWIIRGDFSLRAGYEAAAKIQAMQDRPSAVFCASDEVALGLVSGLHSFGIRVPDDISVIGFDDIELSAYCLPALTTIRQDRRALGCRAARLLLDRLRPDAPASQGQVDIIDVELVVRDSTAPPKD
jgi:LacI family repressor for deo operon, udp, cdd, tsx, nupC, and nupG